MSKRRIYLVTRESIATLLANPNPAFVQAVIGKALVNLLNRQTQHEATANQTEVTNEVGFSHADAKSGCLTAKYWLKHKRLEDWMIAKWTRVGSSGFPRLCKYWKQLDEEAHKKVAQQSKLI